MNDWDDDDSTPVETTARRIMVESGVCPHCRRPHRTTHAGLFELHFVRGRWRTRPCRGSGKPT